MPEPPEVTIETIAIPATTSIWIASAARQARERRPSASSRRATSSIVSRWFTRDALRPRRRRPRRPPSRRPRPRSCRASPRGRPRPAAGLRQRPGCRDPPAGDDRHRITEPFDQLQLVGGEDDRDLALGDLGEEGAAERVDAVGVEAGEGLVEDQQVGFVDQRDAELDPLLVAERERLDRVVGPRRDPEALHPAVRRRARVGLARAVQPRHVEELVVHPHLRVEAALLGHVADAPPRLGVDRRAAPEHLARVGGEDEGDAVQRRRLAVTLAQLLEAEHRFAHPAPSFHRNQREASFALPPPQSLHCTAIKDR